jgi:hypothetical protein
MSNSNSIADGLIEPTPQKSVTLAEAIRSEMQSKGIFRAETMCPEFADEIEYLRGTAKNEKLTLEMAA